MEKIRVVFGSDDGIKIKKSHLGDSPYFFIYDILKDGKYRFVEKRENIVRDMDHAGDSKLSRISEILKDADLMVSIRNSPNFKKMASEAKFQPVLVKVSDIKDAILLIIGEFDKISSAVNSLSEGNSKNDILFI